jgi:hypothetical protein
MMESSPKNQAALLPPFTPIAFPTTIHAAARQGENGHCGHFLGVLREFYDALPEPPAIEAALVAAASIPQPQQRLLVHFGDMTSTLGRHYGEPIVLKLLERQVGPHWYRRHIVLETENSRRPIEYGAIQILLPLLSEAARREVVEARAPFGAILARHGLAYRHCPGGFFKIRSNRLIEESLGLAATHWLYGRCNCMSDSVGRVVAEVVEVLPPGNQG